MTRPEKSHVSCYCHSYFNRKLKRADTSYANSARAQSIRRKQGRVAQPHPLQSLHPNKRLSGALLLIHQQRMLVDTSLYKMMTPNKNKNWTRTLIYMVVGAALFPILGVLGSAVLFGGNISAATTYLANGYVWLLVFQAMAGAVSGLAVPRMHGNWIELFLAGCISAYLAIWVFDILFEGSLRQVSIPACAATAIPVGVVASGIAALPRLITRIFTERG